MVNSRGDISVDKKKHRHFDSLTSRKTKTFKHLKAVMLLHSSMTGLSNELESLKAQREATGLKLNIPG